jgi:hypothetical protein
MMTMRFCGGTTNIGYFFTGEAEPCGLSMAFWGDYFLVMISVYYTRKPPNLAKGCGMVLETCRYISSNGNR